jgi:hypothetical protein
MHYTDPDDARDEQAAIWRERNAEDAENERLEAEAALEEEYVR